MWPFFSGQQKNYKDKNCATHRDFLLLPHYFNAINMEYFFHSFLAPLPLLPIIWGSLAIVLLLWQFYIDKSYYLHTILYRKQHENKATGKESLPPASVIVYANDNAESLRRNIPVLFGQEYPDFEVIVVDDASTDDTPEVLQGLATRYPHLYSTKVPADACALSRRKLALTLGIKAAKNDCLLLLDAACRPASPLWLRNMMRHFAEGADIVLGYSRTDVPAGFTCLYKAFDRLLFSLRYLSCAVRGCPYMGVGSNLAYRKSLFFEHKGFSRTLNLRYGDDDLFVNEVATGENTRAEIAPESFVTVENDDFDTLWRIQKMRHFFTMPYLRHRKQVLFAGEQAAVYLFYGAVAALMASGIHYLTVILWGVLLLVLRGVLQGIVFRKLSQAFDTPQMGLRVLLFELMRPLVNGCFRLSAWRRREDTKTWRSMKI